MLIPEAEARKESIDLERSAPVVLADGQTWYLPKPWITVIPSFHDGKAVSSSYGVSCGPELDALISAVTAEDVPGIARIRATQTLGAFLLLRNYDLNDEELASLLVVRLDDEASMAMVRSIMDVATGRSGPKP